MRGSGSAISRRAWLVPIVVLALLVAPAAVQALLTESWDTQAEFTAGGTTFASTVDTSVGVELRVVGIAGPSAVPWWDTNWRHRQCAVLTNPGSTDLLEPQFVVSMDTAGPIGAGLLDANGDDLRAAEGTSEIDFWIEGPLDNPATQIWVQPTFVAGSGSTTVCFYYDNPGPVANASDPVAPFTYTAIRPLYVAVAEHYAGRDVTVAGYADGTAVEVDPDGPAGPLPVSSGLATVNAGTTVTLAGATFTSAAVLYASGPISVLTAGNGGDSWVPLALQSTQLVMPNQRGGERISLYAIQDGTSVTVNDGTAGAPTVLALDAGDTAVVPRAVGGGETAYVESTLPVLAFHHVNSGADRRDAHVGVPATTEPLYGIRARFTHLGYVVDGTSVTGWLSAGGPTVGEAGNRGQSDSNNDNGGLDGAANAEAIRWVATQPISVIQQADRDGFESTAYLPESELNVIYRLPGAADYVSLACPTPGAANIDAAGTTIDCNTANPAPAPGKGYSTIGLTAGSAVSSLTNDRFYLYQEPTADDEINVFGPIQARALPVTPTATTGSEESRYELAGTWTSQTVDTGGAALYDTIDWTAAIPTGTTVRAQIATAPLAAGPFNFVGPDGSPATFFTVSGAAIDATNDGDQFFQVRIYLDTTEGHVTPEVDVLTVAYELPGIIRGTIFDDSTTPNGVLDGGEPGIDGATVELYRDDGNGIFDLPADTLEATVVTAGGGLYEFLDIPPGDFFVLSVDGSVPATFVTPSSSANPMGALTLGDAGLIEDIDIGYQRFGAIDITVFSDTNGNGTNDTEPGIDGVTVDLYEDEGNGIYDGTEPLIATTVTAGGVASFPTLTPGTYFAEADPATAPADHDPTPTTPNPTTAITVSPATTATDTIGFQPNGAIDITVFSDTNGNGTNDTEPGIDGVSVDLYEDEGNGTYDGTEPLIATTVTAGGVASFPTLTPGTYFAEADPATAPADHDPAPTTANPTAAITVTPAATATDDIGFQPLSEISGTVFVDIDEDGLLAAEPGIAGATVDIHVDDGDGSFDAALDLIADSQVTAADGTYTVSLLPPGLYFVNPSAVPAPALSPTISVPVGTTLSGGSPEVVDIGYTAEAVVSGVVFEDVTADGDSTGDPGLVGVTVELRLDDGDGVFDPALDLVSASGVTDLAGAYSIAAAPGDYFVYVDESTLAAGFLPGGTVGQPSAMLSLASLDTAAHDIGFARASSVSVTIFNDNDLDGVADAGEPVLSGVDVSLGPLPLLTQTTDGTGQVTFTDLVPGLLSLDVAEATLPAGTLSPPTAAVPIAVTTTSGSITELMVGYPQAAAIAGGLFVDPDGDGIQDTEEPGLAGVTVRLWRDDGDGVLTGEDSLTIVSSGANGAFDFGAVYPGTFFVEIDLATLPAEAGSVSTTGSTIGPVQVLGAGSLAPSFGFLPTELVLPATGLVFDSVLALGLALLLAGLLVATRRRFVNSSS